MVPECSKNPSKILISLIVLIIILSFLYYFKSFYKKASFAPHSNQAAQAIPVSAITLQKKTITLKKSLPGRIVPFEVAQIRPQVNGIISDRFFTEGSFVKEGTQLYQIDPAPYQAAYDSAVANLMKSNANLNFAELRAKRAKELIKSKFISPQDYDDAMAQLAQATADISVAKAAVETTKINLAYTKVYAPLSGHIGRSELTKGALVTANQSNALALITQMDPIFVDLTLPIHDFIQWRSALKMPKNNKLLIFLEGQKTPYPYEGKIQFTDITVDETTNAVLLRTLFPNPNRTLLPGLFVMATLQFAPIEALLLPQRSIIRNPDGSASVWYIDKHNKAYLKKVQVEQAIGDDWLIKTGVLAGDIIITDGIQKLKPGSLVMH